MNLPLSLFSCCMPSIFIDQSGRWVNWFRLTPLFLTSFFFFFFLSCVWHSPPWCVFDVILSLWSFILCFHFGDDPRHWDLQVSFILTQKLFLYLLLSICIIFSFWGWHKVLRHPMSLPCWPKRTFFISPCFHSLFVFPSVLCVFQGGWEF